MVILNFTVPFALEAIPKGLKKRTMRPVRANPNSVWNRLYAHFLENHNDPFLKIKNVDGTPLCSEMKIKLQLWWQQRSRKYVCDSCNQLFYGTKDLDLVFNENDPCPNYCNGTLHKEAHKLADAVLTNMTKRTLGSLSVEEFRLDGFTCDLTILPRFTERNVGLHWFAETYKIKECKADFVYSDELLNFEVYIIEWEMV